VFDRSKDVEQPAKQRGKKNVRRAPVAIGKRRSDRDVGTDEPL
jgi:hypothetical protein